MKAPPRIADAARKRITDAIAQIRHSVSAIESGRPGDAEYENSRKVQVLQARTGVSLDEAARVVARPDEGAERIWGKTVDFVDVAFFERGRRAAREVARIVTKDGAPLGTGFLISPRLMMTNNHVIGSEAEAAALVAEFEYERDVGGRMLAPTTYEFEPTTCFVTNSQDDLDYTVVALGRRISGATELAALGYLPVSAARNKHQLGDFVNIIQHPDGRPKEAVIRENQLVARSGTTLDYIADTEPGSSGSPVLNVQFALVALHHWGTPHRELTDENGKTIPKTVNEGIRASSISSDLTTLRTSLQSGPRSLIDEALQLGLSSDAPAASAKTAGEASARMQSTPMVAHVQDGVATWNIPLSVSIRLGDAPLAQMVSAAASAPGTGAPEARVELDPDYSDRDGYDPEFLPGAEVPLPKLSRDLAKLAAKNLRAGRNEDPYELKYHHYSVIMNGARKLAFVSAVNIDGATSKDYDRSTGKITDPMVGIDGDGASEASELWFPEHRIRDDEQTPRDFYEGQTTFDAQGNQILDKRTSGHRNRMFQKGHLTRRQDPLWGDDESIIKFANADTFHVTNCSPQVGFFNMGIFKQGTNAEMRAASEKQAVHPGGNLYWRALEEFVLTNARAERERVSVFTGAVFDDENDIPWDRGRQEMRGFKAPRQFWKLLLRVENNELQATALVADQSPLIDYVPEALLRGEAVSKPLPYDKIKKYHFSVAELQKVTGLAFGATVMKADTFGAGGRSASGRREVRRIEDVAILRPPHTKKRRK
ncbi:hypothetical protein BSZ22_20895 [Bradyrhizobium canariense]|uniref:Serine protease n=1 Tax=Bradyrhizobium canariense TaxID=255045 RepID=A0A1X3FPF2_9BRAD|nr:hypothetical protein BSZ22_20895 [Bradyrhizobium canariense]OSI78071.1 hypothetical protein BSZ23_19895 [Bradyrhizobium canariense]OSI89301.1 hypothetical protein BSZ25_21365 [Bradyrhizobium canariense]OSI93130.1 hypothetical protein BSZ24_13485 [Bradyrhizobium canariense]OSJ03100.1 hypothetical protein BSZ16_16790 [Bradyrhizobium canariense]